MGNVNLIAIAGVVGVGKTTLAKSLAKLLSARMIAEEYDQNPYLARQLAGEPDAALPAELFFLFSRGRQLDKNLNAAENILVCDYIFQKNRIFAQLNLTGGELDIYDRTEKAIIARIITPRVVIYLQDSVENCLGRIQRRGRYMERNISSDWLMRLNTAYDELFENWTLCPLIRIDCRQYDIRQEQTVQNIVQNLLNQYDWGLIPEKI